VRFGFIRWLLAASAAALLHGSLLLAWYAPSEGAASPPPGPSFEMADSMAGILGEAVEIEAETEAPQEVSPANEAREMALAESVEQVTRPEPLAPTKVQPVESPPQTQPIDAQPVELAATAPIDPVEELSAEPDIPAIETREVDPISAVPLPTRDLQVRKLKQRKRAEQAKRRQREAAKAARSNRRGDGKRRAGKRGTNRTGQTGNRSKRGGRGRGRASPGAIASFKSRVRARIAGCVRSRVSGRGRGRVVVRFGVSSGGGATGVSASGSSSIRGVAAAAARGCSFPRPPAGAAGMRFSFPVAVR